MNTDELRAADIETAVRWAQRHTGPGDTSEEVAGLVLLHFAEQNADQQDIIEKDRVMIDHYQQENTELRRVLVMWLEATDEIVRDDPEATALDGPAHVTRRLLAGEVQDADVSPPVKFKPGSDVVHAHDCPCWTCEGYREDMAREVHDA